MWLLCLSVVPLFLRLGKHLKPLHEISRNQVFRTQCVNMHSINRHSNFMSLLETALLNLECWPSVEYSKEQFVNATPLNRCMKFKETFYGYITHSVDGHITRNFRFHYFSENFGLQNFVFLFVVKDREMVVHICRAFLTDDFLRIMLFINFLCMYLMHTMPFIMCIIVK